MLIGASKTSGYKVIAFAVIALLLCSCRSRQMTTDEMYLPGDDAPNSGWTYILDDKKNDPDNKYSPTDWRKYGIKPDKHDDLRFMEVCQGWLGVPYKFGGHDKSGTDCSGLIMEIYLEVYHKKLHRNSAKMYEENCKDISQDDLQQGDLIFYGSKRNGSINHVGIYLKNRKFLHASSSGVTVADMDSPYFVRNYVACGRVIKYP